MGAIRKKVQESWSKSQNPNMFGVCPVIDNTGKIISLEIASFGFLAEFFEQEDIQRRLIEATPADKTTWSLLAMTKTTCLMELKTL